MRQKYPSGTVRKLLTSDLVTLPTRTVLEQRLTEPTITTPRFFDEKTFATLKAVCARLIPQPDRSTPIDVAGPIDTRLAEQRANGWRYDSMPSDGEAYRLGLQGIDDTSTSQFSKPFSDLTVEQQHEILGAIQQGTVKGQSWERLDPRRFFEELLVESVEIYYSHPLAQEEIGYVGMADAHGWHAIGLNQLEPHEPHPLEDAHG